MNDRQRWNDKYARGSHTTTSVCPAILELADRLPTSGRALDVAGGAGRQAIWLATRGLDVTLADVSDVGLKLAADRARDANCSIHCQQIDLQQEPLPSGPWDLILSVHFLWRALFPSFQTALATGGTLVVVQPTLTNLQRHEKPPAPFLLADQELPTLMGDLEVEYYREGWLADGQHAAVIVARRATG